MASAHVIDRASDWLVPQYREQLAMLHMGLRLSTYLLQRMGHPLARRSPGRFGNLPNRVIPTTAA